VKLWIKRAPQFSAGSGPVTCRSDGLVVRDLLIAADCDKQLGVSSNPNEGGTLAGFRKVSCRPLFAAE